MSGVARGPEGTAAAWCMEGEQATYGGGRGARGWQAGDVNVPWERVDKFLERCLAVRWELWPAQ